MGPVNVTLKPKRTKMACSSSINYSLFTFFFSSSERWQIIFANEGEIGCSSFAAISVEIVARRQIMSLGKFQWPTAARYLSKILQAINSVSIRYSFLMCKSNIFCIPYDRSNWVTMCFLFLCMVFGFVNSYSYWFKKAARPGLLSGHM